MIYEIIIGHLQMMEILFDRTSRALIGNVYLVNGKFGATDPCCSSLGEK